TGNACGSRPTGLSPRSSAAYGARRVTRVCKDCGPSPRPRPAPHPGPRCATHHREFKRQQKRKAHAKHVESTYGLKPGEYEKLYQAQGSRCAICRRASGIAKRLAVDHDHRTGLARGLLCGPCNKVVGNFRDSPETFERAAEYLRNPPAIQVLGERVHRDSREKKPEWKPPPPDPF